jgi:hypothetical protein
MHDNLLVPSALPRRGEPTDAPPGTEDKIRVMTERATRHEPLFHPLDNSTPYARAERMKWVEEKSVSPPIEETLPAVKPEDEGDYDWEDLDKLDEEKCIPFISCPEEAGL